VLAITVARCLVLSIASPSYFVGKIMV